VVQCFGLSVVQTFVNSGMVQSVGVEDSRCWGFR
jgi:hypothetical protein